MQRKQSKGFVELEWECPNCHSANKGSQKVCASCGAPQPEDVKFQRAANEKIITDEKVVSAASAGADIHCGFCGTRNPATATSCSQCGADLKEGKARQAGQVLQAAPESAKVITCKSCGTENPGGERLCNKCGAPLPRAEAVAAKPVAAVAANPGASSAASPKVQPKKTNWLLFGAIGAFLMVCCIAIFAMFVIPSKSVQGTVADVYWQTSVPLQEVRAVDYSNERGNPPAGAYNVSCRTESQEICEDKTVDRGNGFAEVITECHTESQDYCSYTVDEWTTIQSYDLSGSDLFPEYAQPSVFNGQRLGNASATLTVTFDTPKGTITYTPGTVSEFQQFQIGSTWTLKLNALGGVLSVGK